MMHCKNQEWQKGKRNVLARAQHCRRALCFLETKNSTYAAFFFFFFLSLILVLVLTVSSIQQPVGFLPLYFILQLVQGLEYALTLFGQAGVQQESLGCSLVAC